MARGRTDGGSAQENLGISAGNIKKKQNKLSGRRREDDGQEPEHRRLGRGWRILGEREDGNERGEDCAGKRKKGDNDRRANSRRMNEGRQRQEDPTATSATYSGDPSVQGVASSATTSDSP